MFAKIENALAICIGEAVKPYPNPKLAISCCEILSLWLIIPKFIDGKSIDIGFENPKLFRPSINSLLGIEIEIKDAPTWLDLAMTSLAVISW